MSDATTPPGRWLPNAQRRLAAAPAAAWHTSPGRLTMLSGDRVLATVRSNGQEGPAQRWVLQVPGWEWGDPSSPHHFSAAKAFMTRTGAQIEAEDIIAAAAE